MITGRTLEMERFVDRRLTRILAANPLSYQPGDMVVANRDVYGCQKGEAWRVTDSSSDWITLEHLGVKSGFQPSGNASRNVSVFEPRPISLRAGDAIVFTRNLQIPGVVNGETGTIETIGKKRQRIRLDNGRRLAPHLDEDWLRHIDHAWTSTVHRAQGRTTDTVIAVLDSDSMMTDRALLYVEMSRARDNFILLTDDREQLVHRLEQDTGVSHSALEATGQSLDGRPFHQLVDKEPLRPVLQEWRTFEGIAEQHGVIPFQLPDAKPLLERLYRRAACEGIHTPPAITRIITAHQTDQATRHRKDVQALEHAWESLQTPASPHRHRIAQ